MIEPAVIPARFQSRSVVLLFCVNDLASDINTVCKPVLFCNSIRIIALVKSSDPIFSLINNWFIG